MIRKVKYDYSFKLISVKEVLKKHHSTEAVAEKGIHRYELARWLNLFRSKGKEGLLPCRNLIYTVNFKFKVLHSTTKECLSLISACEKFDISSDTTIISWQMKYAQVGLSGLENKSKGLSPSMPFKSARKKSNKSLTREEELLQESQLLRAENALLKKL